jgi:hypothetical protein
MSDRLMGRLTGKDLSYKPRGSALGRRSVLSGLATTVVAASAPLIFRTTSVAAAPAPNIVDQVEQYVDVLTTGRFPIPPWAGALDGHTSNMSGLPRDDDNIICQPEANATPATGTFAPMRTAHGFMDGGDSAARTGVAAFCNSELDIHLLAKFVKNGLMVRHPKHYPWNNPHNCTRDQLLAFLSGCWRAHNLTLSQILLTTHAARSYVCQNYERDKPGTTKIPPVGDVLLPDDVMYLQICAGNNQMFMEPFGQLALQLAVEVADHSFKVDKTNLMLECIVCGRLNLFVQVHQNYKEMLRWYFVDDPGGNRQLGRVAEELIFAVEQELKRYPGSIIPLLPTATLNLLEGLDLRAELENIDPKHHADLKARFTEASLKDAATTFVGPMKLSLDVATKEMKALGASADTIAKGLANAGKNPADITKALADGGIPVADINQAIHIAFPGAPPVPTPPVTNPAQVAKQAAQVTKQAAQAAAAQLAQKAKQAAQQAGLGALKQVGQIVAKIHNPFGH